MESNIRLEGKIVITDERITGTQEIYQRKQDESKVPPDL